MQLPFFSLFHFRFLSILISKLLQPEILDIKQKVEVSMGQADFFVVEWRY